MIGCSPATLGSAPCCVQIYNAFAVSFRLSSITLDWVSLHSVWGAPIHQCPCKIRWPVHIRLDRLPWHAVWCGYRPPRVTIATTVCSLNPPAVITLRVGWVFRASIISWVLRKYVRFALFSGKSMNCFQFAGSGMSLLSILRRIERIFPSRFDRVPDLMDVLWYRSNTTSSLGQLWLKWMKTDVLNASAKYPKDFAPDVFPIAWTKAWPSMMEHVFNADTGRTSAVTPGSCLTQPYLSDVSSQPCLPMRVLVWAHDSKYFRSTSLPESFATRSRWNKILSAFMVWLFMDGTLCFPPCTFCVIPIRPPATFPTLFMCSSARSVLILLEVFSDDFTTKSPSMNFS